jgi:Zincin-like metallopeptidase
MPCAASSGRHPPNLICPGRAGQLRRGGTGRGNRRAFLCADLGITPETRDDHDAYIASWLKVLKDDKRFGRSRQTG